MKLFTDLIFIYNHRNSIVVKRKYDVFVLIMNQLSCDRLFCLSFFFGLFRLSSANVGFFRLISEFSAFLACFRLHSDGTVLAGVKKIRVSHFEVRLPG